MDGIPAARRGVPQIEVTFDIDANGIVHVTAKDLGTGKEQKITISSSTNMSKDDIDKAVKEAEQYAEEDKKRRESVDTRNSAEQMAYQAEQTMNELGDKISADEKSAVQEKIDAVKEALKGEDIEAIKKAQEELTNKLYEISAKAYEGTGAQQQAGGPAPDGTYEADYKDVSDDNK